MKRLLGLTATLAAFWLLLSGHYDPLLLGFGAFSVLLVAWLTIRLGIADEEGRSARWLSRVPLYWAWLALQILQSAVAVGRQIWSPRAAIRPAIGTTPANDMSSVERVTYANSIALTPGTLPLRVDDDGIAVHALDPASLQTLDEGDMARRVRRLRLR